jgi:heat shock protein HtpX
LLHNNFSRENAEMKNVTKAWSFLAILSLGFIIVGHMLLEREGLLFGLMLALSINCYVYFYEDRRILSLFRSQLLEGRDPWGLTQINQRLAEKAKIPAPRIVIVPDPSPQSLVVGHSLTKGTILITEGLLEKLSQKEIEAVIAYQMATIKTLNILIFAVGSFICSIFLFIAEALDTGLRLLIVEKKNPNYALSHIFTRLVSPFVGLLLRLCIRPQFYVTADSLAAHWLGDGKVLAEVLYKLQSYSATRPFAAPLSTSHMFVVNPLPLKGWTRHYQAQPSIEKRISSLIGYYPI